MPDVSNLTRSGARPGQGQTNEVGNFQMSLLGHFNLPATTRNTQWRGGLTYLDFTWIHVFKGMDRVIEQSDWIKYGKAEDGINYRRDRSRWCLFGPVIIGKRLYRARP